MTEFNQTRNW